MFKLNKLKPFFFRDVFGTGNYRWIVLKVVPGYVKCLEQMEYIDMDTGERVWRPHTPWGEKVIKTVRNTLNREIHVGDIVEFETTAPHAEERLR